MEDAEIIELFNRRDESAVGEVSRKYGRLCAAVCANILTNRQDVEECVNDTLLKAWEAIPPENPRILPAYLARIAKNAALNKYKLSHRDKRGGGEAASVLEELSSCGFTESPIEAEAERKEILAAINLFLEKLSPKKRRIFVKRYWYCDSVSEIAKSTGMTESNVSVTLNRTRKKLKDFLTERGF